MKIQLKKRIGHNQWTEVEAAALVGNSIVNFMVESKDTMVACLFDQEETPVAYISNDDEFVEHYRPKGFSIHAKLLQELVGSSVVPHLLLEVFPGSAFMEVKSLAA